MLGPRGGSSEPRWSGPLADESVAEVTLAVGRGLTAADLAGTIHPYPTYGGGVWNAAIDVVRARLAGPGTRRAASTPVDLRRRWTARRRGGVRS